ncbi:diaminopimelate epimerase [Pseudomonas sp. NPDC086581]|uniref:diaminopimelate epimerase n=1 Tax=Pseudomonas sp. NPDC086581 TaxID=3364432 RepID=UPI0037F9DAC5
MNFVKYQALGNDYLVYSGAAPFALTAAQISRVCDRHHGIGSDGILVANHSDAAFGLRILNPDGSEAEKSGNGLRIFSRYLWDCGLVAGHPFDIVTAGGTVTSQVSDEGRTVEVSMGRAEFACAKIPVQIDAPEALNYPLTIDGVALKINAVSMGNPHCVVFVEQTSRELACRLGPRLENHPLFPRRTNVQFVQQLSRDALRVEIWERGAGYTLSSGTSSCAAASVARRLGLCDEHIDLHLAGGLLKIRVADDFQVTMRGAVQRVAGIDLDPEAFADLG